MHVCVGEVPMCLCSERCVLAMQLRNALQVRAGILLLEATIPDPSP